MSETDLLSRLQSQAKELERTNQEAITKLKRMYEEYLQKPFNEQLKMAREALDHGKPTTSWSQKVRM